MSLASVRPLFRTRLNALGFKEHTDAFDDTNRPQKKLEKLYRINTETSTGEDSDQLTHEFNMDVELVITLRGTGTQNVSLVDRAWEVADEINADILAPDTRLGTAIKNIIPATMSVTEYSGSDDNDLILTMGFTATILCNFN